MKNKRLMIFGIIAIVLLLDQTLKIWVKTNMYYGQEFTLLGLDWARIHFVENDGMAFGISLQGKMGKLALSLFRIIAVGVLFVYINRLIKQKVKNGLLISFALILAGAIGNILDSAFYGLFFSASAYHDGISTFMPEGGGYAGFLFGKVVDMLYFPMFSGNFPSWFPIWAGESFLFFKPVFNLADSSITTGVLSIIFFHRKFFTDADTTENASSTSTEENKETIIKIENKDEGKTTG